MAGVPHCSASLLPTRGLVNLNSTAFLPPAAAAAGATQCSLNPTVPLLSVVINLQVLEGKVKEAFSD
ncbi:hypothetical protein E2C01_031198 [Portunus trituberculatus]|uniref:Uncharacterized protein n=1 Tax=Portunus trituberculatus TaxID=210409 RepID=A0A5B7EXG6_PORTR|nr:hypothetical protein [Portunus trituberculatus]